VFLSVAFSSTYGLNGMKMVVLLGIRLNPQKLATP
jgi:hypothetical protein